MRPEAVRYLRPTELAVALAALSAAPRVILAGGSDLYATGLPRVERLAGSILDITAIERLRGIRTEAGEVVIGAAATWAQVRAEALPVWFRALQQSAAQVGGEQVQNVATVAGNLCNASPAADGVPPLLALSSRVDLSSVRGVRTLTLDQFVLGSRRIDCRADELLTAIRVPMRSERARSVFYKLGARSYLVISIVSLAATLDFDARGRITYAALAVGSCAARARRLASLESRLLGQDRAAARNLALPELPELAPLDDIRGSAHYRRDAVAALCRRALRELCRG